MYFFGFGAVDFVEKNIDLPTSSSRSRDDDVSFHAPRATLTRVRECHEPWRNSRIFGWKLLIHFDWLDMREKMKKEAKKSFLIFGVLNEAWRRKRNSNLSWRSRDIVHRTASERERRGGDAARRLPGRWRRHSLARLETVCWLARVKLPTVGWKIAHEKLSPITSEEIILCLRLPSRSLTLSVCQTGECVWETKRIPQNSTWRERKRNEKMKFLRLRRRHLQLRNWLIAD